MQISRQFLSNIDASLDSFGVAMCQKEEGIEPVIAYASSELQKSEKINPAFKLQYLGLKFAVVDKVHVF